MVGDSFIPTDVFARGLAPLAGIHSIDYLQVDGAKTPLGLSVREYEGDPGMIAERMPGVEVLVVHGAPVTEAVVAASDTLRLICCARGGPVNVDVSSASRRRIPVTTTPGKNADAVADQTLAFMLMLARRFPYAQQFLLNGNPVGENVFEGVHFLGHDLAGHVLGLVGYGNVGRRVARRALAFQMSVLVYDPFLGLSAQDGARVVASLDELLVESDFVSVHARATPENENLFDRSTFSVMKKGAYFINTARETLVNEQALDDVLTSGKLAGAALDVLRPRSGSDPHPLLRHSNVVLTPHIGGATYETLLRGAAMVGAEIERLASGRPLEFVVNGTAS